MRLGGLMAWFDRYNEFKSEWSSMFLCLRNMGMWKQWWPSLEQTLVHKAMGAIPSSAPGALAPQAGTYAVKHAREKAPTMMPCNLCGTRRMTPPTWRVAS